MRDTPGSVRLSDRAPVTRVGASASRATVRTSLRRVTVVSLALLGLMALLPGSAAAFDTGYHYDLTAGALLREGFNPSAAQVAQVTNTYDDMFQSAKTILENPAAAPIRDRWDAIFGPQALRDQSDDYQHFDDCPDYAALKLRWDRLLKGTWAAVEDVKQRPQQERAIGLISILGQSLHEVQDFYAHSNWSHVVAHPDWPGATTAWRDETWFEVDDSLKETWVLSSPVPDKDWAGRDYFDRAYHEAFLASWEWAKMVRVWAGEPLWQEAAAYRDQAAAGEALRLMGLAMYVENGHWKGPGSGDTDELTAAALQYVGAHVGLTDPRAGQQTQDLYLVAWKRYCPIISGDPQGAPLPPTLSGRVARPVWMAIDTLLVGEAHDQGGGIDSGADSLPDFYAVLSVSGVDYTTNIMKNRDDLSPAHWRTWAPLEPGTTVSLTYALWDADVTQDEQCDIVSGSPWDWTWSGSVDQLPAGVIETQGYRGEAGSSAEGKEAFVHFRVMREPVTSIVVPDPTGMHGWYTSAVPVELVAHDFSGAGIDHVDYSVTEGAATVFGAYEHPLTVGQEGKTTLRVFATDKAGNREDAQEKVFWIDGKRPVPVALNQPTVKRGGRCLLQYKVQDDLPSSATALTTIKVRTRANKLVKTLRGTTWQPVNTVWTVRFSPGKLKPGTYTYEVYATDFAGNQQERVARSYVVVK